MRQENANTGAVWTRRQALKGLAVGVAACAIPRVAFAARPKRIPVAVQLYSVRNDCKKDFDGAMERVAKMGYEGVEFAGYYNYGGKPRDLKKRLDDLGIKAAGTHIGTGNLRGDGLKRAMDFHQQIGCKFLIVPGDGAFCQSSRPQRAGGPGPGAAVWSRHACNCSRPWGCRRPCRHRGLPRHRQTRPRRVAWCPSAGPWSRSPCPGRSSD